MRPPLPFPAQNEWLAGRYKLPKTLDEDGVSVQPELILWLELPSDIIVSTTVTTPRRPVSLAQSFEESTKQPAAGPPRRPARIRVAKPSLAKELSGCGVPVDVTAVPELDAAIAEMFRHFEERQEEPSYFGDGSIPPAVVARLFATASILFRAAPWRRVAEYQVLRVDIPVLGVDGACLSVIGGGNESLGLLLFGSLEAYRAFVSEGNGTGAGALISLSFDRKKDLPARMAREIDQHRWPVAGAKAYPVVISIEDGMSMIVTERDYRIANATALAFLSFFAEYGDLFENDEAESVQASYTGDDGVTVTLTAPHGEAVFDVNDYFAGTITTPAPRRTGRNEPCPCGSGKKYKKCHLGSDEQLNAAGQMPDVHQMDSRFVREIGSFAYRRFGPEWCGDEIEADDALPTLYLPWIVWTSEVAGKRVADSYLEENEAHLSAQERDWFAAQKRAWLSVWEVLRVEPGTVEALDLLTGERRPVSELLASQTVVPRDVLLARVIDFAGRSYFGGLYARSLPPSDADEVARAIRSKLRFRNGAIPPERLRGAAAGRFLIERWMDAVRDLVERRSQAPDLRNTDGDPLLFVKESFRFIAASRPEIMNGLAKIDGAGEVPGGDGQLVFLRAGQKGDNTVVGRAVVGADTLIIETNSERRAAALRRRVRAACPDLLRSVGRTTESPGLNRGDTEPSAEMSAEEKKLLHEYKERHYREWLSTPLPALGGKTPRAAARSKKSRESLDLLLRDMENRENRRPVETRFDFAKLRMELKLDG